MSAHLAISTRGTPQIRRTSAISKTERVLTAMPVLADRCAGSPDLAAMTTGAVTRRADRLERSGYMRREPDRANRRRVVVQTVPERVAAIARFYKAMDARWRQELDRYSDAQMRLLLEFLGRERAHTRAETMNLREQPNATGAIASWIVVLRATTGAKRNDRHLEKTTAPLTTLGPSLPKPSSLIRLLPAVIDEGFAEIGHLAKDRVVVRYE